MALTAPLSMTGKSIQGPITLRLRSCITGVSQATIETAIANVPLILRGKLRCSVKNRPYVAIAVIDLAQLEPFPICPDAHVNNRPILVAH